MVSILFATPPNPNPALGARTFLGQESRTHRGSNLPKGESSHQSSSVLEPRRPYSPLRPGIVGYDGLCSPRRHLRALTFYA